MFVKTKCAKRNLQRGRSHDARKIPLVHTTPDDPRQAVPEALVQDIGEQGTLIAYNISFERGVLLHLAEHLPQHVVRLQDMADRFWYQLLIFRKHYKDWRFGGSNSLKSVLPLLVPELSYKDYR